MFKSIRAKVMFFLAGFAISLLIVAGYVVMYGVELVTEEVKEDSLRDKAIAMANITAANLERGEQIEEKEKTFLDEIFCEGVSGKCFLISKTKQTIGCVDKEKPYNLKFEGSSTVQDIYKNEMFYLSAVARVPGQESWFVVAEETRSEAFKDLNLMKTIVITMITILIFLLWPLSKRITLKIQKPIKDLAEEAVQIANGDIGHGIGSTEPGELTDIANAFNLMLDNLKSTMQQVLDKSGEAISLQEIMEYVEDTYDNLPSGIISINTLGEITTFNEEAANMTGYKAEDLLGIDIKNPTPPGLKNLLNPIRRCLSRGSLQLKTITDIKNKDGDVIPVIYSITIQFGVNGEVMGAVCVFRRIEDLHRFEESTNRMKNLESLGEMAASLAHEIKNPLTSIKGYAQYMKVELEDKDLEELDIILYEVDRLTNMLDRFLNFARPKMPKLKQEDMNALMSYVATLVKRDLPSNIEIRTDFQKIPKVMVDKEMFEPLFLNLILNAIQAMPEGGEIWLRTHYDKKRNVVCAEVQDNGEGISQEISNKIFDPFFTTKAEGTGMGLAIASRTVESHRGVMEVESVVGEMTKFTIMLQAVEETEE